MNAIPDSRCGLPCSGCTWRESHGCGGCIETMGHPFHGKCPIANCCQSRGHAHCGECDIMPCDKLYAYSYLDPEHGDKPQGRRIEVLRKWAARGWKNVLLTSAGFEDAEGRQRPGIVNAFLEMLSKPVHEAKILFIPTAARDAGAREMAVLCRDELLRVGCGEKNIFSHDLGGALTSEAAMAFDAIYFTGGDTGYLLNRLRETGFDRIVKKMVYSNKVYVGVSAGSLIATPNIGDPYDPKTAGLCLVNAYLSVHCPPDTTPRDDLPLPHFPLTDDQSVLARDDGYCLI